MLLTGSSGFIGQSLSAALRLAGHEVISCVRTPEAAKHHARRGQRHFLVDFTKDHSVAAWLPRLAGVEVVINAVGILREEDGQTFDSLHLKAPAALFSACVAAGVQKVIQVSAVGADASAVSRYHSSKFAADEHLLGLIPGAIIAQPSLVFGQGGASASLFLTLASLPAIPLPGHGDQLIQPIHVHDLSSALVELVESDLHAGRRIALVGPEAISLRRFLLELRSAMKLGTGVFIPVPSGVMKIAARLGNLIPWSMLDSETLSMLERGNTADPAATASLLRRRPRPVEAFVEPSMAVAARVTASLSWLLPLLRLSIAAVWIGSGIVSLGLYPVESSYAILASAGITGSLATLALYGGAVLDVILGIATLVMKRRRELWILQAAIIVIYMVLISFRIPEYWLHPFGPILKNLPMLVGIWLLYELEERKNGIRHR